MAVGSCCSSGRGEKSGVASADVTEVDLLRTNVRNTIDEMNVRAIVDLLAVAGACVERAPKGGPSI